VIDASPTRSVAEVMACVEERNCIRVVFSLALAAPRAPTRSILRAPTGTPAELQELEWNSEVLRVEVISLPAFLRLRTCYA
jgi:chaperone required for assembly of F1-ATPase